MSILSLLLAGLTLGFSPDGHGGPATRTEALAVAPLAPAAATAALASVARDPWLGQDKAQHLFMSFALTDMAFGLARAAGLDARAAMPVAAGAALAAGIGKEIYDRRHGRFFSLRDLAFDLLGMGVGLTLASYTR